MKKISFLIVLFLSVTSLKLKAQDVFTVWPALGDFHVVMSATYHQAEKGKLDPIKQRSGEMVDKAALLNKSAIPAQYDSPALKTAIVELNTKTSQLYDLIMKNAKDEKINKSLIQVHNTFHKILDLCNEKK